MHIYLTHISAVLYIHTSMSRSCSRFDSVWVRMHSHGLSKLHSGVDGDRCEGCLNMRKLKGASSLFESES